MLAVVQCASSDGGSPRLPTRITPPLRGVSAARAPPATSRIAAAMASNAFRTGTERLMRVPPGGVWQRVRRLCSGAGTLVNGRVGREEARGRRRTEARYRAEGASPPLRRVEEAAAYGTVMVVPSPVAPTVNVPAPAFGVYV